MIRRAVGSILAATTLATLAGVTIHSINPPQRREVAIVCTPAAQVVCTVLGLTVCRRNGCP